MDGKLLTYKLKQFGSRFNFKFIMISFYALDLVLSLKEKEGIAPGSTRWNNYYKKLYVSVLRHHCIFYILQFCG